MEAPPAEYGEQGEFGVTPIPEGEPQLVCQTEHTGDVTDLRVSSIAYLIFLTV